MVIVYSTLLMAVLGLAFGTFLAYSAKKFEVKEDPRVEMIKQILPGANCGACGYAGCEAYAKAVVAGKATFDMCIPGRPSGVSEKIREIMEKNAPN
ncbi:MULTISPECIES: RnfABCDGE type electron transport complex subunit B [Pseudothermotoga]|jgi:electron transport complex protein RnfB|uniref:Fe-S cluster domain protein n=1 Tax=Pseudothermotoga lettingae (strain ATCC BAA-301 / DSM 14385 / NBRC 107922 / TMO) TaxID=416591 RepID=A8F3X7_PSELT|nr:MULTISPECIES: RnfABCDGE type electron transport complex subunit B [Pseudothermotoga]ABV32861.1 Fe-S cluster domain protein [Pseudothermotoga lettingae TMO]KUK21843.1 MAG: Fe-S cluster domain protein [Pseudothermotoga lettingae]MDI3494076.1 H+/Na+-translocating ferredoxin:NAD+ oxidoreductase subunit [Pseudothermotoga sp.]MDK2884908.1 H+/Na+-translocating ferredoxin:NAD+ oxidoreductase subunit [Pseudothermotoga sp.]GLI48143.1 rnfB-related protein [Pseudothermotoga lettingae TMO]